MSCNNKFKKSTLNAYGVPDQTVAVNGLVAFANFQKTGCSINFIGGTSIEIDKPGLYQIIFNGTVAGTAAGNVVVQLLRDGVMVPGATAETLSDAITDFENVTFATIVEILPSCNCVNNDAVFAIRNAGIEAVFSTASVNVVKLC